MDGLDNGVGSVELVALQGCIDWITRLDGLDYGVDYEVGRVGKWGWISWITGLNRLNYEVGRVGRLDGG